MAKITQYSRISHHTTSGFTGSIFTIPTSNDFTDGSWTIYDLAPSEIGVNETDGRVFMRCGPAVKEFVIQDFVTASTIGTASITAAQFNINGGEIKKFRIDVKGVSDIQPYETIVSELWGGFGNATGSAVSFTGGTYSTQTYKDFSAVGIGPVLSLSGTVASLDIYGAAGYTISWSTSIQIQ